MIDRIRLTAAAKVQLSTLKRRTGIEHYNALCRHAMCVSLANPSEPPLEDLNYSAGLEIDWKILTGGNESLYLNFLYLRYGQLSAVSVKSLLSSHIHRGISYLVAKEDFVAELSCFLETQK